VSGTPRETCPEFASSRRDWPSAAAALLVLLTLGCAHRAALPPPATAQKEVTFTEYSPLSSSEEIARRMMTPLAFLHVQQLLSVKGQALRGQPIDLAREKFSVYVPAGAPPKTGYGLLVFVAPWSDATVPRLWRPPLDRHGLIFVAATNSGNETSIYDRRLPLALLGYENIRARYPLDLERVYIWGLSGGSRVAEMTALGYPDVFRGALLNAGADPISDDSGIHIPPAELFHRFQQTRLVYVTGGHDELNLHDDEISRGSMKDWCAFNLVVKSAPQLVHETLDAGSLDRALDALEQPAEVDAAKVAECNAGLERDLSAKLADAAAAIARGDLKGARARINAIDLHFGGLAGKAILELEAKLAPLE
jgi:pimeloyl-ACP methyl ester carboxylesterase